MSLAGRGPPALATVPEPMIVPAAEPRVFAACAMSRAKVEGHVDAGVGPAERAGR